MEAVKESIKQEVFDGVETNGANLKQSLHYTKRDEFTSERFKIKVRGLSKFFPPGHFKKLLVETMQLAVKKVKPSGHGREPCYVTFNDEESAQKALLLLEGYKWKGRTLSTAKANPAPDPLLRVLEQKEEGTYRPDGAVADTLPLEERVMLSVTPYAHISYDKQLEKKQDAALEILRRIGREVGKVNPQLGSFLRWQKLRHKGAVSRIIASTNSETKAVTVGFRVSSYKEGNVSVGPVMHLKHISDAMKSVVMSFEEFVRSSSYAAFDPITHEGVWRQLTVRTSNNSDCLLVVVVHPQKLGSEGLGLLKERLTQYCRDTGSAAGVTGLYCVVTGQKTSGVSDEYEHLWGATHITETVLGKTFRISPQAFFQVNTPAAEKLYEAIGVLAELDQTTALLDVCCGTGTIGICLAEKACKIFGLEIVDEAVADAQHNAAANNITNIDYLLGNCEQTLPSIYGAVNALQVKAIVDPPRAGLPSSVISSLRRHAEVSSVVYVACDPNRCHQNFQALARPPSKSIKGQFFVPVRAVAVDLFPHTDKFELVLLWERYDEAKWRSIIDDNPRAGDEKYLTGVTDSPSEAGGNTKLDEQQS
ncbi:tRNA (uracil-5-)-methyltransferase homolog A-like [Hyalella azteca]|uniref:tRNA (uracil(54)-C(5))-methyltransferase n=1 Tax=Hyalella azteca TaxID=294128 RepID=A0A8B7N8G8_HYAAZ|nr:tRNA (uracil-5-)-methyltransferase homolog A-like [Hyalella azteca]